MKTNRPALDMNQARGQASSEGFLQLWTRFWFTPVQPIGLHCLRFLAGLLFIFWLVPLAGQFQAWFGLAGWFDRQAFIEASRLPGGPPVQFGWSLFFVAGNNAAILTAFYCAALASFALFALGLWPRITGILTWLLLVSFLANPVTMAETDQLLAFYSFLLMVGYVLLGQWHGRSSWLRRIFGPARVWPAADFTSSGQGAGEVAPSFAANLAVRLLQVQFAIAVVASALHKLQAADWWSGIAFWYPLHPPFKTTMQGVQAEAANANSTLFMLSLAQYIYLVWELAFPCFAWRRRWRPVLLGGAAIGWIGALAIYQEPLFGPVFFFGCLTYLTPQEWSWLAGVLGRIFSRSSAERTMIQDRPRGQQATA